MSVIQSKCRPANLIQMDYKEEPFPFLNLSPKKLRLTTPMLFITFWEVQFRVPNVTYQSLGKGWL